MGIHTSPARRSCRECAQIAAPKPDIHFLVASAGGIDADWPRLVELHQRQRCPDKRHVLAEIHHLAHPLRGILDFPKTMHLERDRNEETDDERQTLPWLYSGGDAHAAGENHCA